MWKKVLVFAFLLCAVSLVAPQIKAQSTGFTYQGSLQNGGIRANGNYDFEFRMFDAAVGGNQLGITFGVDAVAVTDGVFKVNLDFGDQYPSAQRFIEIRVRPAGVGEYTTLAPRTELGSTPYAWRSNFAGQADNALNLGGIESTQYILGSDSRLSDARNPLPNSPGYIWNNSTLIAQPTSGFNISGDGNAGGTLSGQSVNAITGYRLLGFPFAGAIGSTSFFGLETGPPNLGLFNTYAGYRAGNGATSNTSNNSFFGANAGRLNSLGNNNSFFGVGSGEANTFGGFNAFFGATSGAANLGGSRNTFIGVTAGRDNTGGSDNTFVGSVAGQRNLTGGDNTFLGAGAGVFNETGSSNVFIGKNTGQTNTTGGSNTIVGAFANVGAANLTNATAIGSGALVSSSNTLVLGRNLDAVQVPGSMTVTGSLNANGSGLANLNADNISTGTLNAARLGNGPILNQTSLQNSSNFNISGNGTANRFLSSSLIVKNDAASLNNKKWTLTTTGPELILGALDDNEAIVNPFMSIVRNGLSISQINLPSGKVAIGSNSSTARLSVVGGGYGSNLLVSDINGDGTTIDLQNNSSIWRFQVNGAVQRPGNFELWNRSTVFGALAFSADSDGNIGIGTESPAAKLDVAGTSRFSGNMSYFSAAGNANFYMKAAGAPNGINFGAATNGTNSALYISQYDGATYQDRMIVNTDGNVQIQNKLLIGLSASPDKLAVNGIISFATLGAAGSTQLCRNASNQISTCSSSLRYKTNIAGFSPGLSFIRQLRPISFEWKDGGIKDIGFGAEDIAKIDPRFVTYNDKGEVEGVKYDRLTTVLVNAVTEQQAEISEQKAVSGEQRKLIETQGETIRRQQEKIDKLEERLKDQGTELDALKKLICSQNPDAGLCKEKQQ